MNRLSGLKIRGRRGAAVVEATLVFLAFGFLLLGVIEGANLVWRHNTLTFAVRNGARAASLQSYRNQISAEALAAEVRKAALGLDATQLQVSVNWPAGRKRGAAFILQGTYTHRMFFLGYIFPSSVFNLSSRVTGVILN